MARTTGKSLFYNFIFMAVLLVMLALSMLGEGSLSTLTLEQQPYCGMEEHIHKEECYIGDVLMCNVKAHTHSQNCYLVLLEDNDINWLLEVMGRTEDGSLESVIDSTLVQALNLNASFTQETLSQVLDAQDISLLNKTIVENEIEPAVVFNESLATSTPQTNAVTLKQSTTLTEATTVTVSYDVAFEYSATPVPALAGVSSVTVVYGNSLQVSTVSDEDVTCSDNYTAHFLGWQVNDTDVILEPGTIINWDMLESYAVDGMINLTGRWEEKSGLSTIRFYINMDSKTGASGEYGDANWTSIVHTAYAGNVPTQEDYNNAADKSKYSSYIEWLNANNMISRDDNATDYCGNNELTAYQRDVLVDAIVGERDSGVWISDIPTDAEFFDILKEVYGESGTFNINDVTYTMSQLNTSEFTIRWHHFKYVDQGGIWHLDGLLVKKQGQITVDKLFGGDADNAVIEKAKENFYILAQNGSMDASGNFMPYHSTESIFKQYLLVLDANVGMAMQATYPNATVMVHDAAKSDTANDSYEWLIENVALGEYWQITEYTDEVMVNGTKYIYYAEYSVRDTDGNSTAVAEYGTTASVIGKTYALDEDPEQGLLVDFWNYYYPSDSLLIKKEDNLTGEPIGGAEFELWQYNSEGVLMQLRFSPDETTDQYKFDNENGTITAISTGESGYTNIALTDFSYEHGKVVLREVTAPSGYDLAPTMEISEAEGQVVLSKVYYEDGKTIASSEWADYAEVNENGGVLVIKDRTSNYATVTATKVWEPVSAAKDKVVMVLQANGSRATGTFPTLANVEVTVTAESNWSYIWENLPTHANGELVIWSVKEIVVGGETTLSDGESFANWTCTTVSKPPVDSDGDGIYDTWNVTLTNTPRRTQIILTKVDENDRPLTGAVFTLVEVELVGGQWQMASGAVMDTQTTNANGVLNFDSLVAGSYYLLTETAAPEGYFVTLEPIVLTVNGDGLIQQVDTTQTASSLSGEDIRYTGAYNIRAVNPPLEPLPETGGVGVFRYAHCGLLLMLAATVLSAYKNKRRKEDAGFS